MSYRYTVVIEVECQYTVEEREKIKWACLEHDDGFPGGKVAVVGFRPSRSRIDLGKR